MKLALFQIDPVIGDIKGNKEKIINGYRRAVEDKADLAIFPELILLGYPPLDLVEKKEFRDAVNAAANEIAAQTNSVGLLFGSLTEEDDLIGTNLFNSALLCYDGKIQFVQHKTLIPNYDVFDEMRYFESARDVFVHDFKGEKLGISICEDIWNDKDFWKKRLYSNDPVERLLDKKATFLINISASPYSYGKRQARLEMLSTLTKKDKIGLAYVCNVGAQTDLIFDGASMCFDNGGNLIQLGKSFSEDYLLYDTKEQYPPIIQVERSFEEEIHDALIYGLKEYCEKLNFERVLIGLSGGLDSAIVTYLAVQALGKEYVHVVMLPSKYSSKGSVKDSEKLIANLGITSNKISIQSVVNKTLEMLHPIFGNFPEDITEENLQSRTRGLLLMALSNKFKYLLLSTGNKSEMAVGYATLYGDMCGGLAVIADVYKTDLYRIANFINRNEEIIPDEILTKVPSAELRPNQTDQDSLPPYALLDKILQMYLEENKEIDEISRVLGERDDVNKVLHLVDRNEFKRKQAAPALRVSNKAFGYGRRFPIVQGWRK
ncbi:MAG: NAD+ synthase [Ignavibacteriaceae bacterium]|nr:NAD+ synthase [Ignavibacteriaceae bacterium]